VGDEKRLGLCVRAPDVEAMNAEIRDLGEEVLVLGQLSRNALPVIVFPPGSDEFLTVTEWDTLLPVFHCFRVRKPSLLQSADGILHCGSVELGLK
jgi:hypothetical protein